MLSIGILCGLFVMLAWGVQDFLSGIVSKKLGSLKAFFAANAVGVFVGIPALFYAVFFHPIQVALGDVPLFIVAAFLQLIGTYNFFKALEKGEVSVVVPITASYSIITVFIAIIIMGESLDILKIAAIFVVVIGIFMTSGDLRKLRHMHAVKGVREALIATVFWGFFNGIIGVLSKRADIFTVFLVTWYLNSAVNIGFTLIKGGYAGPSDLNRKGLLVMLVVQNIIAAVAWFVYNYGLSQGLVSIVVPVSSLFPAITAFLGIIILKERLLLNQKVGIGILLFGLILISL
jgi:bacterial/archaeal transporter family protein